MKDEAAVIDPQATQSPNDQLPQSDGLSRRTFMRTLGAGLLIAVCDPPMSLGQAARREGRGRGGGGGEPPPLSARLHIGRDGIITVFTGKVECGQGARAELTQAAAEELRLPVDQIALVMADTGLVPNDGITAGSRSTPSTVPAIRQAAAAARNLLADFASREWGVARAEVEVQEGKAIHAPSRREKTYADLAAAEDAARLFAQAPQSGVTVTPVKEWRVLGTPVARPNRRDLVTGAHRYPSDIARPGMLYGKVLRPPSYGAKRSSIDLAPAKAMKGVTVVQEDSFIGFVAPTSYLAQQALDAAAATAKWETPPHPSSGSLYEHLKQHAQGGVPANPFAEEAAKAAKRMRRSYHVAYVQHAPMEPRAAVAEWSGDGAEGNSSLTVWTATQNPFGVRSELARAFQIPEDKVRVIVPDFGGGFGGKHSGEAAVEAARLARLAGKPVSLRWTRKEEFTWAYFRPAGVIEAEAALDEQGSIHSWHFVNINSGPSSIETPYRVGKSKCQFVQSNPPLRHGSYRGLAATANTFGRECLMDELAAEAGRDPLEFRLAHLDEGRLRDVLTEAARRFDWAAQSNRTEPNVGVGLACGTEKGSYVAACVEVFVDPKQSAITVRRVCQTFECGPIVNPANLLSQVQGAIVMGLGPALREEMEFEDGRILNAAFEKYLVPRFEDVPEFDIHLLNRPDLPLAGAGETPLIALAPAIANAVFKATGRRVREMPIRVPAMK